MRYARWLVFLAMGPRIYRGAWLIILVSSLDSGIAGGQSSGGSTRDCVVVLPPNVFTRVAVLLDAQATDSAAKAILPAADILTQAVAERIRASISGASGSAETGGTAGQLPIADSVVSWRQLGGSVVVTTHRDGSYTWIQKPSTATPRFIETGALDLLTRALSETSSSGERIFWPEQATGDSLSFRLSFISPVVRPNGKIEPVRVRVAMPVFTLPVPWFKAAAMVRQPRIDYPLRSEAGAAEGGVTLDFIVDSTGRVDPASVREYWPPAMKRPTGYLGDYYRAFLAATVRGLPSGKFEPATVAGCPFSQQVRQLFDFKLSR